MRGFFAIVATILFAQISAHAVTVTFDSDRVGIIAVPASKEVTVGDAYGSLPTLSPDGDWICYGWFTQAGGRGVNITRNTLVSTSANHTLYAAWTNHIMGVGISNAPWKVNVSDLPVNAKVKITGLPSGLKYNVSTEKILGVPQAMPKGIIQRLATWKDALGKKQSSTQTLPIVMIPLAVNAQGNFTGFLVDATDTVTGTWTLTVNKNGKMTAKITNKEGAFSYKAASWNSASLDDGFTYRATLSTSKKNYTIRKFEIELDTTAAWNTFHLTGTFDTTDPRGNPAQHEVIGQRNSFVVNPKIEYWVSTKSIAELNKYQALSPLVLNVADPTQGASVSITAQVKKKGVVTYKGKLQDGKTSLSGSSTLLIEGDTVLSNASFPVYKIYKATPTSALREIRDLVEIKN